MHTKSNSTSKASHNAIVGRNDNERVQSESTMKVKSMVALISGKRGHVARLVNVDGAGRIQATQDNNGLSLKDGQWGTITSDGVLTGSKQARLELGAYVNGRTTGAKVELLTKAQFDKRSFKAQVTRNMDAGVYVAGRAVGNVNEKGLLATKELYGKHVVYWQCEQDSNAWNHHERGRVTKA